MKRILRILSVALITAGVVILADAGITVAWQEPLSTVYGSIKQNQAEDQLRTVSESFLSEAAVEELPPVRSVERRAGELAELFERGLEDGTGIARIDVPAAGIDQVVIQGTDTDDLTKGPGHYPATALPGQGRTVAIAGHRTTYGAPFRRIDDLEVGDEVTVEMPYATFSYSVTETDIVEPSQVEIVDDIGREQLVLTACHPLYSAAQRYAVFAELTDATLAAGAEGRATPD